MERGICTIGDRMTDLLSIRVSEDIKSALILSSKLSEAPVSKLMKPFLDEISRIILGASILFHIDRGNAFRKERLDRFMKMLIEPSISGSATLMDLGMEDIRSYSPQIIWDFLKVLKKQEGVRSMNDMFDGVELDDRFYINTPFLRAITYYMGTSYLTEGGDMDKLDQQLATRQFFHLMLHYYYRHNARGTTKALNTQWYTHQQETLKIEQALLNEYISMTRRPVVDAIVVEEKDTIRSARRRKRAQKVRRKM